MERRFGKKSIFSFSRMEIYSHRTCFILKGSDLFSKVEFFILEGLDVFVHNNFTDSNFIFPRLRFSH